MLTIKDCLDLCACDEEEVLAVARHEHIPEIVAAELAEYLVHTDGGVMMIKRCIVDEIHTARKRGDAKRAERLVAALNHVALIHARPGELADQIPEV